MSVHWSVCIDLFPADFGWRSVRKSLLLHKNTSNPRLCPFVGSLFARLSICLSHKWGVPKKCSTVLYKCFTCTKKDTGMFFGTPDTFHWLIVFRLLVCLSFSQILWIYQVSQKNLPPSHKNVSFVQKRTLECFLQEKTSDSRLRRFVGSLFIRF